MDRQPVVVDREREAVEVDGHSGSARYRRPDRRFAQGASNGKPTRVPGTQGIEPTREREVLSPAVAQRHARHPEAGQEHGREIPGHELDRRLAPEPTLARARRPSPRCYSSQSICVASGRLMYADARVLAT